MAVLSAALLARGKTLVARQFIEISRLRIEGLLSAFLKLIEASDNKDHTYIESDSVRYVYLPMEQLYLVLVTNKQSNILEDLETLKLMQKTVQDCCDASVTEATVLVKAFEIVFSLDEIISFGYRESVTLSEIKSFTEMESSDEKLSLLLLQEKMREERKRSQMIASRLDKERSELLKQEAQLKQLQQQQVAAQFHTTVVEGPLIEKDIGTIVLESSSSDNLEVEFPGLRGSNAAQAAAAAMMPKGMQLGKKKKPTSPFGLLDAAADIRPPNTT